MPQKFITKFFAEFRYTFAAGICIVIVAYAVVVGLVLAVPHLPLANKRTFYGLLRAQMAVDEGKKLPAMKRGDGAVSRQFRGGTRSVRAFHG